MGYLELSGAASQSSEGGEAGLVGEGAHAMAHKVAGGGRYDAPAANLTPLRRAFALNPKPYLLSPKT